MRVTGIQYAFLPGLAARLRNIRAARSVGRVYDFELVIHPVLEEERRADVHATIREAALHAEFVVLEEVGAVGLRQPGGATVTVDAAGPEALGVQAVDHHVFVDVVLQPHLDRDVVVARIDEVDTNVVRVVGVVRVAGGIRNQAALAPCRVAREIGDRGGAPAARVVDEVFLGLLHVEPARAGRDRELVGDVEGRLAEYRERFPFGVVRREPPRVGRRGGNAPAVRYAEVVTHRRGVASAGIAVEVVRRAQELVVGPRPVIEGLRIAVALDVGREVPFLGAVFPERAGYPVDSLARVGEADFLGEVRVLLVIDQEPDRVVVPVVGASRLEAVDVVSGREVVAERAEVRGVLRGVLGVLAVASEVGRRRREGQVVGDVALDRERVLGPVVLERVGVKCDQLEIADRRVVGILGVRVDALRRQAERRAPVVADEPLRRNAAAGNGGFVPVLLDRIGVELRPADGAFAEGFAVARRAFDVVDKAGFGCRETDETHREGVIGQRNVDHARDVPAVAAFRHALDRGVGKRFELRRIGLVGDNAQRSRLRAGAEQCALGAGQHFDTLDVDEARVDGGTLGDGLLVEINGR